MRRARFAQLCEISRSMVSRYESQGALAIVDDGVDAAVSLEMLAGRLDDGKRERALERLAAMSERRSLASPASSAAEGTSVRLPPTMTARQERDAVDRDLKLLEYGQRVGDLVLASDVEAAAARAVADLREVFTNGRREMAADICATFGLPPDKAGALQRFLLVGFERMLGRYSEAMAAMVAPGPIASDRAVAPVE